MTRLPDGGARVLLWQPQKGKKKGVRWWDFGGSKKEAEESFGREALLTSLSLGRSSPAPAPAGSLLRRLMASLVVPLSNLLQSCSKTVRLWS